MAADSPSQKVKLLCSFGGKILPRPSDGVLRYAGGDTRVVTFRRKASISDLFAKINQICGGNVTAVKYQLPDEDLDALISVSSQEDLDNMLEEFDRVCEVVGDGSARIRVFLFDNLEKPDSYLNSEANDTGQSYIDAVNGVGIRWKDSLVSNVGSNDDLLGKVGSGSLGEDSLVVSSEKMSGLGGRIGNLVALGESSGCFGGKVESFDNNSYSDCNFSGSVKSLYQPMHPLPLNQFSLPPLHPMHYNTFYVPPVRYYPRQFVDCHMCQKGLLHQHSETFVSEYANANGNGNNGVCNSSMIYDPRSVLLSHQSEDPMRLQASLRLDNVVDLKSERFRENVEAFDHSQALHAPMAMNSTRPQAQILANGNVEAFDHTQALHALIGVNTTRPQAPILVNNGNVEGLNHVQTLHAPIAMNSIRPQAQVQAQASDRCVEAVDHAPALHTPIGMNNARTQAPIQVNRNVEAFDHAQASHVPIGVNMTKPQAPIQVNGKVEASDHAQALHVPSGVNMARPQAPIQVNGNVESFDHAQAFHATIGVNTTRPVNNGNVEGLDHAQALHAPIALNTSRPQAQIQVNNGNLEALDHAQALHAPIALKTVGPQAPFQINNGNVEASEHTQALHAPIAMSTARSQVSIQSNNGNVEASEHMQALHAPIAMNTARSQVPIQNNGNVEASEHTQALHAPIAMNSTRPQSQVLANNGNAAKSEPQSHIQVDNGNMVKSEPALHAPIAEPALHAPIAMNVTKPQAQIQGDNGNMAKNELNVEAVQLGNSCGTSGFTQEIPHVHEKENRAYTNVETSAKVSVVEAKVGNMAVSAQFGPYGYAQVPKIPQPIENGRMLINPSAPNMVGSSNTLHSQFHDPFQSLTQNMIAPPNHMNKREVVAKPVMDGNFQVSEPPSRVSVPDIPYYYDRPINGTKESFHVTTFETPIISEHPRPIAMATNRVVPILKPEDYMPVSKNNHATFPTRPVNQVPPYPLDFKPEHTTVVPDNNHIYRSQAGDYAVHLGNGSSYIVSNGNSCTPINEMPLQSMGFTHLQGLQSSEINHVSTMMPNHEPLMSYSQEMRAQTEVSYASSVTHAYNNNITMNAMPVQVSGNAPIQYSNAYGRNGYSEQLNGPTSGNAPIQYSNTNGRSGHSEQLDGLTPLDPLICNQDSQINLSNMPMIPQMPNKTSSREFVAPVGLYSENHLAKSRGLDAVVYVEEGGSQHVRNSTNPVQFMQGEEHAKQVQGLTEQVKATVLEPSLHPAPVNISHDRKESNLPSNKESALGDANAQTQNAMPVSDDKIEGIPTKQAINMKFGFPITDDLGRLQIIKNSDLEELRELGSGTFGTVYHGKWRGTDVAIKRINDRCFSGKKSEEERMKSDFWNEACNLADLHHPNIVAFYGVVLDGPGGSFATVTEFMVNGSLRRALHKNEKMLDKRKRLLIAMDIAFGMEYLHCKNMVHFDLKSDNLLVNLRDPQRPICKVADLGLSKVKKQTLITGGVRGTLPWMAPELLNGDDSRVSDKIDVFSFGIVMWELLTGEEPYADLHYGGIIGGIVSNNLRPPIPESCDPQWRVLMEQCWSAEPSDRPTFAEIASRLRSMSASVPRE